MADGEVAGQLAQHVFGEDFGDQAHALDIAQVIAVGGGDAGGFLAAMLEGVEAEIDLAGGFRVAVDGHYAAFFFKLWIVFGESSCCLRG